jgi:hypothetical protein
LKNWYSLSESDKKLYNEKGSRLGLSGWNVYVMEVMKGIAYIPPIYEITIDNSQNSNTLTNYQVLLNISNDSVFFSTVGDKKFMEFYDTDKATLLNHYVELWGTQNYNAKIWIKIPNIPANSIKKVYLMRNHTRITDLSNPYNTFDFYDDFNVDLSKWSIVSGTWTLENGMLKTPVSASGLIVSSLFSAQNLRIVARMALQGGLYDNNLGLLARYQNTNNFYQFENQSHSNYLALNAYVNGSWNSIASVSNTNDLNFHVYDVRVYGSRFELWYDGVQKFNATNTLISASGKIGIRKAYNYYYAYIDYVYVTKYVYPEPTVSYVKL